MKKSLFKVIIGSVRHDGKLYGLGKEIKLTEKEAKALSGVIGKTEETEEAENDNSPKWSEMKVDELKAEIERIAEVDDVDLTVDLPEKPVKADLVEAIETYNNNQKEG